MTDTEVEELTIDDLAEPVEIYIDWDRAASLLKERENVSEGCLEAVFESLARSDSYYASRQELYENIENDYEISERYFRTNISALADARIVLRHNSKGQNKEYEYEYLAGEYTAEEWRSIWGKTFRNVNEL